MRFSFYKWLKKYLIIARRPFDLARAFSATGIKLMPRQCIGFFQLATLMDQTRSSSNLSLSKTNLGMTLDSNEWVEGYQMRAKGRMILQTYHRKIQVNSCGWT
jgi:hypothetical protein